jgi:peptidoglycan hydrolase CwlO-like protein
MQEFFTILSNFGFPVAVASYLLFRFEKKLEDLTKTNGKLVDEVESLKQINADLLKDIKHVQSKINQLEKIIVSLKKRL